MSSSKKKERENLKSKRGAEEGSLYQKVALLLLAEKGYEFSKRDNSEFRDFAIGREISIGKDAKLDDVVFSYTDQHERKNFIFLQIKHKQDDDLIDSQVLSTAAKNVRGSEGNLCRDFNLKKYFISYLSVRDELNTTKLVELKGGKIKYVALFTNIALDSKELNEKGFNLKKAPDDVVNLLTLKKSTSETIHCYQLGNVSDDLRKILKKSSDLDRLAGELAKYVVWENYRENKIIGIDETPTKHYHFGLGKYVIKKSDQIKRISIENQTENKQYCDAHFREAFLDCDETATNLYPLRNALFETIRDLDQSKKDVEDDELKRVLKAVKLKTVPAFGKSKQNIKPDLPREWIPVYDKDITEFLQHLVFIVEQPRVAELEMIYKSSIQRIVVEDTSLQQFLDTIYDTGPEFRNCVEKVLEMDAKKRKRKQQWISDQEIKTFIEEKKQLVSRASVIRAMTLMYKNEVMQCGKFNDLGKILEKVKNFLTSDCKILCVNTPGTLLSSIKISQALNEEEKYPISLSLNILNSIENRDCVLKAFELESTSLLTIECRHEFKNHIRFLYELVDRTKRNSDKKIILIMQQENFDIFREHFKNEGLCVIENDSIELKDFEPKEDPLAKKVLVFQGQKERVSLSDITGIDSWPSYVHTLATNEQSVIDGMTLDKILYNDEIEVGSKPAGASSLEGAYAQMCEEINVENLVDRLKSQEHGNDTNDMYIFSGINGSSKEDETDKLIQCLGEDNENGEFKNRLKTFSVHILDDDLFNDEDFNKFCPNYPEKRIFWISLECEINAKKFVLQGIYNPEFYLKRKFKNVIIKKDLKQQLIKDDLSEIFIFHCAKDKQQLYKFMELNAREMEQIENSCMIKIFSLMKDAEDDFKKRSKQNITVHLIEFEEKQFIWRDSHGSLSNLLNHIDKEEVKLIEEDNFIRKIKDRKVVIFADDPGMGKTTTQIKLYETEIESSSIVKSHWVIGIKLRDHLDAVRALEFKKDAIDIASLVKFLLKIDSKLNNNLATNLLKIVLDKSKSFQAKPLLLIFDGFDEVLDEVYRNRILMLLQFIKDKTAAKLWITTRCHFKNLLEERLSTIAIQFSPMDDAENAQYIATYLQHRLFLTLNKDDTADEKQKIDTYTAEFVNKMKSFFRGDISTFIGTPLQLYLLLEYTVGDFKNSIEEGDSQISVFNDICEVYEYFINRKYDVYFQKKRYREREQKEFQKCTIDGYHKKFAVSKILKEDANNVFERYKNMFLLVGVIKSQGTDLEFIHKTFEEFFAAKAFIDWIKEVPNTKNQEDLLTEIFMKPDYELIRTFMNLQLHKMTEQVGEVEAVNELDKNLDHYGKVAADLFNKETNPLINEDRRTPLYIAVLEGNKDIAWFLLNILKRQPDVLKKFLLLPNPHYNTPLHLACIREDVQIVKALLDAAAGISKDTLQESIVQTFRTASCVENFEICKEFLGKANDKLGLILKCPRRSALCTVCSHGRENLVELFLQEFEDDKHSLEKLLLDNDRWVNALGCARSITIVEKLISAAKSMKDNNETLKKMLLPDVEKLPFQIIVRAAEFDVVEKVLDVAKEIDEDTLKQLLLNDRYVPAISALHIAAERGRLDIIKLLLETGAELGIEILEKLIIAVNEEEKNAVQLMIDYGHEILFDDFFKILKEDKYSNIREKVEIMQLESRFYLDKTKWIEAIEWGDIQKVKDILSNAKNSSLNPNERLRILLLSKNEYNCSTLYIACREGDSEIIEDLIFYAKEMDDDNHTLKQLLLLKRNGKSALHVAAKKDYIDITKLLLETASALDIDDDNHTLKQLLSNKGYVKSALHVAAKKGHVNITKLLLDTASGLGIDILEELIFHVNEKGKNAIHLIAEHGHETIFAELCKMLKDEHPIIWEKVMKVYDNIPFERTLYSNKKKLIMAIKHGDIEKVKDILNKVKNSSVDPNESLRFLLLSKNIWSNNTLLHTACIEGNREIMKELLSYAMNMDDGGATLKELLTKPTDMSPLTPLKELKHRYAREIKQIVDSLIVEARKNNRDHAVNILEQINNQYSEEISSSEESDDVSEEMIYEDYFDSSSSSEESDDVLEAWVPV